LGGNGIEFGAASHNTFNLPGSINIAPGDDADFYREQQIEMCGSYAEIDIVAEAHAVPLPDASQDYIISSHVVEHLPNPIAAFIEWTRLLKPGGIVFMIVPQPDAHPHDAKLPLSTLGEITEAHLLGYTVDTWPYETNRRCGHYFRYTLDLMLEVIQWVNDSLKLDWEVVATERVDSKVSNGFTVVCRVTSQPIELVPLHVPAVEPVDLENTFSDGARAIGEPSLRGISIQSWLMEIPQSPSAAKPMENTFSDEP